jgi:hypothetical protein
VWRVHRSARSGAARLARVLDFGADPADEPDLRIRKRTAVASALAFIGVAIVIGITDVALELIVSAGLATGQAVAFSIALLAFRRNRRLAPLYVAMSVVGTTVLFLSLIPSGGFMWGADDLTWLILVPLGGVLFLGPRAAAPALGAIVIVVVAAVAIDPLIRTEPPEPSGARLVYAAVNLVVPAGIALALVVFIDDERVRAKAESEALLLNVLPAPSPTASSEASASSPTTTTTSRSSSPISSASRHWPPGSRRPASSPC